MVRAATLAAATVCVCAIESLHSLASSSHEVSTFKSGCPAFHTHCSSLRFLSSASP